MDGEGAITLNAFHERRKDLEGQMGEAKNRLMSARSQVQKASNDVEAIHGAMQELAEWERRFQAATAATDGKIPKRFEVEGKVTG